jgi:hypothetical protein
LLLIISMLPVIDRDEKGNFTLSGWLEGHSR